MRLFSSTEMSEARKPANLISGDTIGVISTARKIHPAQIDKALRIFRSWGLRVKTGKHLFSEDNQFSGTDNERIEDLQEMMDDPEVKAIICARGGYGTSRIIDQINFEHFVENPKWIAGFSDVTAILCHLNNLRIETIHSIMPILFDKEDVEDSISSLKNVLFGDPVKIQGESSHLNIPGEAEGEVIGGNLTIITHLIGTRSGLNTKDKILFIEDIDEYLYHIDRMMVQLQRTGMLRNLKGLIVGQMTAMNDNEIPFGKNSYEIIFDHVKDLNIPISFGFPVGHEEGNFAIPCSRKGKLIVSPDQSELSFS